MTKEEFISKWRATAEGLARLRATVDGALLCDQVLSDFRSVMATEGEQLLTLREAAHYSGYSADHLGRLVREGRIPNLGKRGSPRLRVADLPMKPREAFDHSGPKAYDPTTDARSLVGRRKGGAYGSSQDPS
jgi:hypothetical protein